MKFTINKDEFTKGLLNVCKIINPKPVLPTLQNVKLVLDNNGLQLNRK
jgi:DNA polymerase III sliding clamp (beta) subunit (PCNA family)